MADDTCSKITPWAWRVGHFLALVPFLVLHFLIALLFKPNQGNLHWRQLVALRFLQAQRAILPGDLLRWYIRRTSTGAGIRGYCVRHAIPHRQVTLESAALDFGSNEHSTTTTTPPGILHILTPSSPKSSSSKSPDDDERGGRTILYLHGGGFVNPMRAAAHMPLILKIASASRASRVAVLEYDLAPEHPYPTQTIQSVAALRHLVEKMEIPAQEIILAGDSAGGQMVGSLLAHIVRPCPYAVPISLLGAGDVQAAAGKKSSGKLGGALFLSPLAMLETKDESYVRNGGRDYLDRKQIDGFEAAWRPKNGEVWSDMCEGVGSKEVWDQVFRGGGGGGDDGDGGIVNKVMVVVGTAEVFLDSCRVFADRFLQTGEVVRVDRETKWDQVDWEAKDAVYVECEGEVHVQVALDCAVGYEGGLMMRAILGWLSSF